MREVKEAKERKNEILDAAEALFAEKGYAATSTGDILERVEIARGTLYYHFESKAALMEALVGRLTERLLTAARDATAASRTKPALNRLLIALGALKPAGGIGSAVMEHLHDPGNVLLHDRIERRLVAGVTSILADIVRDGIAEGVFETPFPEESVELVVVYMTEVMDGDLVELTEEGRVGRLRALSFNLGRLFGLGDEALSVVHAAFGLKAEAAGSANPGKGAGDTRRSDAL